MRLRRPDNPAPKLARTGAVRLAGLAQTKGDGEMVEQSSMNDTTELDRLRAENEDLRRELAERNEIVIASQHDNWSDATAALVNITYRMQERRRNGDDWILSIEQLVFMFDRHYDIARAEKADDDAWFQQLMGSEEWRDVFGNMGFDEAYDRYECVRDGCE